MCGIAGFISAVPVSGRSLVERMGATLRHRGPDGSGFYVDDYAGLAHRRLSIIDVAAGQQPMANEDGSLLIVYNGEIFNHDALRQPLEAAGHTYGTRCDTETIVHSYEQYGPSCVERFRGMFSFAIWDRTRRRLFCARDRLGIKPFYYWTDGRLFAFASEIKALFEHPDIGARLDEETLPEYLSFGYVSGQRTMFRGVRKLLPGHTMEISLRDGRLEFVTRQYWDVPEPVAEQRSERDWIADCRQRLEETVRMRLMSDVPLGVFLSGGVDSSAIAALMKPLVEGRIQTFSVGYREAAYSELGFARQVSEYLDTDHHEVLLGREEFFQELPKLIWHEDEPIAWPSSVSLFFVSKLAAERVKVVLTGEGSDELFAGYARYGHYLWNQKGMDRYRSVAPPGLRRSVREWIGTSPLLSASMRRKLGHTFFGLGESLESLYLDNFYSAFSRAGQRALSLTVEASPYDSYYDYWNARRQAPALERMLYADQKTYLVELLMKQDQMSMACSIESRVPLLDHPLVEFASRVPASMKIRNGSGKYIFKRAVEDLLPRGIVHRTKMGFPTPVRDWLRGAQAQPLYDAMLASGSFLREYLDTGAMATLVKDHQEGRHDCTDRLWRLLNLQLWGDLFITRKRQPDWAVAAR
ncbi:MAG: asparagine synthase (glutamine-hydrolyzing) [Bryobacteraceae bacterium]